MDDKMQFKVSSALKNLIGKELITDEYIAVFELVKNAFDANAKNVKIVFENSKDRENSKIIILDDGKGMDKADLENKWLFVAYSAKNDGTEDIDFSSENYRDKINSKRLFAGAKGVGRFSCDRLGSFLNLISIKNIPNSKIENLIVDWTDFEEDPKAEFVNIGVKHQVLNDIAYPITHGTVLEISGLRDDWDRARLQRLRFSLEKLINPIPENDSSDFNIEIIAKDESKKDEEDLKSLVEIVDLKKKAFVERGIINGYVKNFIFESLGLNTTYIETELVDNGNFIHSKLFDRGQLIYDIKELNKFDIKNVRIKLYQLNRVSKANFTKKMGVQPIEYGSVFLYKNGFRIYPFGEEGDDGLLIERRKQQGYNRFLGTRDLIGTIMIYGENTEFRETTSRDGGLVKNESFDSLRKYFMDYALRRLENYVVNVISWGDDRKNDDGKIITALSPEDVKSEILDVIANLTNSKDIIDVTYDRNFLEIFETRQEKSALKLAKNFTRIAEETKNLELIKDAKLAEKHVKTLLAAKNETEAELASTKKAKEEVKQQLQSTEKKLGAEKEARTNIETQLKKKDEQLKIVTAISSQDIESVTNLHHQVYIASDNIKAMISEFSTAHSGGMPSKVEIETFIQEISFENDKVRSISKFGFKKIFEDLTSKNANDIIDFFVNYLEKISKSSRGFKINFSPSSNLNWVTNFSPLDLSIIIDNMISNSKKAKSNNINISASVNSKNQLEISFKNDGIPFSKDISNIEDVFNLGFSTTNSTGIGLYHVKSIVSENGWKIVPVKGNDGCEFILTIESRVF